MRFALTFSIALFASALHGAAWAQAYPAKPIRLIVPYGAGGPSDASARMLGEVMSRKLGQAVVVENRTGAGGRIGVDYVASLAADGYTLLAAPSAMMYFPIFFKDWKRDLATSYTYIGTFAETTSVLVGPGNLPVKDLKEFAAYYKAHPGKVNVAYIAPGPWEFLYHHLDQKYGWKMERIPYKSSSDAKMAALQGDVQLYTDAVITALNEVNAGKLKPLGALMKDRALDLPSVPTVTETGVADIKFEPVAWLGLLGPAGIPPEVVAKLNRTLAEISEDPDVITRLKAIGLKPLAMSSGQMKSVATGELSLGLRLAKEYKIEPQ